MIVLITVNILPTVAFALPDDGNQGSITIHLHSKDDNVRPSGVRLSVYQVAEGSYIDDELQLLPAFNESLTGCGISDMIDHSADASHTLENWTKQSRMAKPVLTSVSDSNGEIRFDGLADGIYLICQENDDHDFDELGYTVEVEPYLVILPAVNDDGTLYRSIDSMPKIAISKTEEPTTSVEVEKHWIDDNNKKSLRPNSILVTLTKDGVDQETVTLSAANNWRYVWDDLDANAVWSVVESVVPKGYKSTVTSVGSSFTIKNELIPVTPDKPPDDGKTPGTGDPTQIMIYLVAMAASGSVIMLMVLLKRRKKD